VNEFLVTRSSSSRLADLGPLPEVIESDDETTWKLFLDLQAGRDPTAQLPPATLAQANLSHSPLAAAELGVQDVLHEARRNNRVAPRDSDWNRLRDLLEEATGFQPPPCAPAGAAVSRLVKRMLLRDQIEWAADHGYLALMLRFLRGVPEDHWVHMSR
jgi:hypothetical protein